MAAHAQRGAMFQKGAVPCVRQSGKPMSEAPRRILIAEDEPVVSNPLRIALSRAGFDVMIARDGREAWEAAQAAHFDLIVTDHQMPSISGSELCQMLYESDVHRETPILMLTGLSHTLHHELLQSLPNVVAIIPKPCSPRDLAKQVRDTLAGVAGQ